MRPLDSLNRPLNFLILIIPFSLLLISSCKDSPTNPPIDNKPPGYQEDIPWPSLADSPWPMYRSDPLSRGISRSSGSGSGIIIKVIDTVVVHSGIVLDADSNLYVMVTSKLNSDVSGLAAYTIEGEFKWLLNIPLYNLPAVPAPIITSSGNIVAISPVSGKVLAVNKNGQLIWETELNDRIAQSGFTLSKDGNFIIYGILNNTLIAVNSHGQISWQIKKDEFAGGEFDYITLTPDSRNLLIPGKTNAGSVYNFDLQQKDIKWNFGFGKPGYTLVDGNGRIYLLANDSSGNGKLYVLDKNREIKWEYHLHNYSIEDYEPISMDKNGNIYVGMSSVISIDYNGNKRWEYYTGSTIMSPTSVDRLNQIYFISWENGAYYIQCLNPDGTLKYKTHIQDSPLNYRYYIPVIGYNRTFISMDRGGINIFR